MRDIEVIVRKKEAGKKETYLVQTAEIINSSRGINGVVHLRG